MFFYLFIYFFFTLKEYWPKICNKKSRLLLEKKSRLYSFCIIKQIREVYDNIDV